MSTRWFWVTLTISVLVAGWLSSQAPRPRFVETRVPGVRTEWDEFYVRGEP